MKILQEKLTLAFDDWYKNTLGFQEYPFRRVGNPNGYFKIAKERLNIMYNYIEEDLYKLVKTSLHHLIGIERNNIAIYRTLAGDLFVWREEELVEHIRDFMLTKDKIKNDRDGE